MHFNDRDVLRRGDGTLISSRGNPVDIFCHMWPAMRDIVSVYHERALLVLQIWRCLVSRHMCLTVSYQISTEMIE